MMRIRALNGAKLAGALADAQMEIACRAAQAIAAADMTAGSLTDKLMLMDVTLTVLDAIIGAIQHYVLMDVILSTDAVPIFAPE